MEALGHLRQGNIQGFNRYAYANNNPYAYVDPDGRNAVAGAVYVALMGSHIVLVIEQIGFDSFNRAKPIDA